jgi:hypothetical protein
MGTGGPRDSRGKKLASRQVFIVDYLQFVDRKHLHQALCSAEDGVSTAARKVHKRLSMSGIATPLKEWFCGAIRKLPKR